MMILILLTREDEHNERGQNAQNKHDREDSKGDTLVAERALRENICFFLFCVERVRFLLDLRLFLSWCYKCVGGLKM